MSKENSKIGQQVKSVKKQVKFKKFDDLEGKFLLVRVGTEEEPATTIQIKEIEKQLVKLFENNGINCLTFVTHHAVDMKVIKNNTINGV